MKLDNVLIILCFFVNIRLTIFRRSVAKAMKRQRQDYGCQEMNKIYEK